jgi:hypothetical protein
MIFSSVKDTFVFLSSGNLYEKLTILLLQTFCLSCWNLSKLTISYSYCSLKYGLKKSWFALDTLSKIKSIKKTKSSIAKSKLNF